MITDILILLNSLVIIGLVTVVFRVLSRLRTLEAKAELEKDDRRYEISNLESRIGNLRREIDFNDELFKQLLRQLGKKVEQTGWFGHGIVDMTEGEKKAIKLREEAEKIEKCEE